jgi:hypothetical protein
MTDGESARGASDRGGIVADGLAAAIPAALIASILNRQLDASAGPVKIDARSLQIVVSPDTIMTMVQALGPARGITVALEPGVVLVTVAGLPPLRVEIPTDGLRLTVDEAGVRLGG